jgi:uncharacterized membrane protein
MKQLEIILVAGSMVPLIIYHLLLLRKIRTSPEKTAYGINALSRIKWVDAVIKHEKDILAIQTMRNWTMAATFLASTAILISLGLLSMLFNPENLIKLSQLLNLTGSLNQTLIVIKLLLLVLIFFTAFFNFTLSIRHYNHAATMINIPLQESIEDQAKESIMMLNHAARYYTLGMRCFYFSIPLALWLFGPLWMFISSWILVFTLSRIDRSA